MNLNRIASMLVIVAASATFLYFAKALLVPFVTAVLIWYIINALSHWIGQFRYIKKFFPAWTHVLLSALVILMLLTLIGGMIFENAKSMVDAGPMYQKHLGDVIERIDSSLPVDLSSVSSIIDSTTFAEFANQVETEDFTITSAVQSILNTLSDIAGNTFLILIYMIFLFFEQAHFKKKSEALFGKAKDGSKFFEVMDHINDAIRAYFKVKITVSLLTASASFLLMYFVGLDFAIFWAFLIFLLNFIPNIGSLVATLFPSALALIQFENTFAPFLVVLIGVGAIQVLVGNLIEPRMMGSSLNISSLAVILSLSLWGTLWGITGMILCVPITVIMMIIFAQFDATRAAAILLSENGDLMTNLEVIQAASDDADVDDGLALEG